MVSIPAASGLTGNVVAGYLTSHLPVSGSRYVSNGFGVSGLLQGLGTVVVVPL